MTHIVNSRELAFQRTKPGEPNIPDGPEEIVPKGGRVPDYVSLLQIAALESAGMIFPVADDAKPVVDQVGPVAPTPVAPVVPPDAPLPFFPPQDDGDGGDGAGLGPAAPLPKASDKREIWEDYAVSQGMPR